MDVQLRGLQVRFGAVEALGGVDLSLEPGRTTVLVGPNGAGKSTLISVLLGLVRPDGGQILANGKEVCSPRRSTTREFRQRLGYLPEAPAFSDNLTGRQVLRFFAAAHGLGARQVESALERVGLTAASSRSVAGYSRGMRQRLGLAVALLSAPDVLVLDEPTGGLDQEGLQVLWSVLEEWRAAGRIVLMSSHELALIERRADQLCVLSRGSVRALGSPEALRRASALPVRIRVEAVDAESATLLAHRLAASGTVSLEGRRVGVSVPPSALLDALRVLDGRGLSLEHLRVEEPGLDEVYQRILEGGPTWHASQAH